MSAVATSGVMIDRPDSADRDDAFTVRRTESGWEAYVHVAAVARLVPAGSAADHTARQRIRSRYLPDRTLRMLPGRYEQQAALAPGRPIDTLQMALRFDAAGELSRVDIRPGRLQEAAALSYEEAAEAIAAEAHPHHRPLADAHELARTLLARRRAGGALAMFDPSEGWATDEEGNVVRLGATERNSGYLVVQELMIAANAAAAQWSAERELPILYRNHRLSAVAPPREALLDDLTTAAADPVAGRMDALRQRLALVQRAAVYEPHLAGHYGLNLPAYTHATSPLRRYPDLVNQRILLAAALGESRPYTTEELAEIGQQITTRLAEWREQRAERYRAAAVAETRKRLADGGYRELAAAELRKLLEVAVGEDTPPAGLGEEVRRRIAAGSFPSKDACRVLFFSGAGWDAVRESVLSWVRAEPAQAITLITMYAALTQQEPLAWETDDVGPEDGPSIFSASVRLGAAESAERLAGSKRDARQQAAMSLIAALTDLPDYSRDLASRTGPVVSPAARMPTIPPGQHPVMTVNQLAQVGILLDLDWDYDRAGADHAPQHRCRVRAVDARTMTELTASGTAGSKSGAKAAAAAGLLAEAGV